MTQIDRNSQTWKTIEAFVLGELRAARLVNDQHGTAIEETEFNRGVIQTATRLLNLRGAEADGRPTGDTAGENYGLE